MASDCDGCWFELWVEERRAKGDGAGSDGGLQPLGGDGFLFPMPLLSTGQYWAGGTGYLPDVFQLTRPATLHSLSLSPLSLFSLLPRSPLSLFSLSSLLLLLPPLANSKLSVRHGGSMGGGGGRSVPPSKCMPQRTFRATSEIATELLSLNQSSRTRRVASHARARTPSSATLLKS